MAASGLSLKKKQKLPGKANNTYPYPIDIDGADSIVALGKDNIKGIVEEYKDIDLKNQHLDHANAGYYPSLKDRTETTRYLGTLNNPSNVALGKTATQSTTHSHPESSSVASLAVDGNRNGHYREGSVSHTADSAGAGWWEVDLGDEYWISYITIYGRTDCCSNRLDNATIELIGADGSTVVKTINMGTMANLLEKTFNSIDVKCVKIKVTAVSEAVHLAEFEAYGILYQYPSAMPSSKPSESVSPSSVPSDKPSVSQSDHPSSIPSVSPSDHPSSIPSDKPSLNPSVHPSRIPSVSPSGTPSISPSEVPTMVFTTKYPFPDPSSIPSFTPFVDQTTTLYLALSGNINDLQNLSPTNLQNMGKAVADYVLSKPLGLQAATVETRIYGSSEVGEQAAEQVGSFIRRRLQTEGAIRLIIDIQTTTRVTNSSNIDERISELIRSDNEGFSQVLVSSVDGSLDTLTGLIANLEDIHPSSSPSNVPSVQPSSHPSREPSSLPSLSPTLIPSTVPSSFPSSGPSLSPSSFPSSDPSSVSSLLPSVSIISSSPILYPSSTPSLPRPSIIPSITPSVATIGENNIASSLYPSFKSVNTTKTETPSVTPSKVPFNASKTPHADDGSRGSFYVRDTTLAGACAAASAAAASASAGSAAAGASASSAQSVSSSDDMRADDEKNDMRAGDEKSQESATQDKTARVEGGTATLSNQKSGGKRPGYSDNDDEEENVDQAIKSSEVGAKESSSTRDNKESEHVNIGENDEMGRSYDSSQPEVMSGGKDESIDSSIAGGGGGDIEQGRTLSDSASDDMKRTNVIIDELEFQDTGSSSYMQYSSDAAGLSSEVSKNQQPVAEIKSARVEGGAATLSINQSKNNKGINTGVKNKSANKPVKNWSDNKADVPEMSMSEKLQVASGSLEDGYDSSWKEKYNRSKKSLSTRRLRKMVRSSHQNDADKEDVHLASVAFCAAAAIFKLSFCGNSEGGDSALGSWLIVN